MLKYKLFYDESFHDPKIKLTKKNKINYEVENGSENFTTVTIGIPLDYYTELERKYLDLEKNTQKFLGHKENSELKGETFKSQRYKYGFSTFGERYCKFFIQYIELIDNPSLILNISTINKFELIFNNVFLYNLPLELQQNLQMRYSILKFIYINKTEKLDQLIFTGDENEIICELKDISLNIINKRKNLVHKKSEIEFARLFLELLKNAYIKPIVSKEFQWDYLWSLHGTECLLKEINVKQNDCVFIIDGKGKRIDPIIEKFEKKYTFYSVTGVDSKCEFGLRMSDILANLIGRFIKNIENEIIKEARYEYKNKYSLCEEWFNLNNYSFDVYKSLGELFNKRKEIYWTTQLGIYNDASLIFFGLLSYMTLFSNFEEYFKYNKDEHAQNFNRYMLCRLSLRIDNM